MDNVLQQYTALVEQGQQAARTAVETWTRSVQGAAGRVADLAPRFDADAAVDQFFDLNERLLSAQRSLAKGLVAAGAAAAPKSMV